MALQLVQYGFEQEARAVAGPTSHVRVGPLQDSHCLTHNACLPCGSWSVNKEWRDGVIRPPQKIQKLIDLIPAGKICSVFVNYPFASNQLRLEVMAVICMFWTERHGDIPWFANLQWALLKIHKLIDLIPAEIFAAILPLPGRLKIEANWKRWHLQVCSEQRGMVMFFIMPTCIGHLKDSRAHWYHLSKILQHFLCQPPNWFKPKQIGTDGIVCSEQIGTVMFFYRDFQTSIGKLIHIARNRKGRVTCGLGRFASCSWECLHWSSMCSEEVALAH